MEVFYRPINIFVGRLDAVLNDPSLPMYYFDAMDYLLEGLRSFPEEELIEKWGSWESDVTSYLAHAATVYLLPQKEKKGWMPGAIRDMLSLTSTFGKGLTVLEDGTYDFSALWEAAEKERYVKSRIGSLIASLLAYAEGDEESLEGDFSFFLQSYYSYLVRTVDRTDISMEDFARADWFLENIKYCGFDPLVAVWEENKGSLEELLAQFLPVLLHGVGYWKHRKMGEFLPRWKDFESYAKIYDQREEGEGEEDLIAYMGEVWKLMKKEKQEE